MILHQLRTATAASLLAAAVLLGVVVAPTAALLTGLGGAVRHRIDSEDGEIVQNILWVAGFAAIAVAVIAIVRTFVLVEAENLPTSGNMGG
jgi:ABC-type uncharacterized transport system permease subunit